MTNSELQAQVHDQTQYQIYLCMNNNWRRMSDEIKNQAADHVYAEASHKLRQLRWTNPAYPSVYNELTI